MEEVRSSIPFGLPARKEEIRSQLLCCLSTERKQCQTFYSTYRTDTGIGNAVLQFKGQVYVVHRSLLREPLLPF